MTLRSSARGSAHESACVAPVWCAYGDALSPELAHRLSLCEALDRILNKGAVIAADVVVSVADVDLLRLQLRVLLSAVETLRAGCDPTAGEGVAP